MENSDKLRNIVARLVEADASTVSPGLLLNHRSLQGSAGRARLDALVRRELGLKVPAVYKVKTYGELESAVLGTTSAPATNGSPTVDTAPAPKPSPAVTGRFAPGNIMCGIDLETVDKMPPADDYWESEFYKQFFTPREIAYCVSQSHPRQHFAARWCRKEALRKCDPTFLNAEFSTIEIVHDDRGRPELRTNRTGDWQPLPHSVSLSHTNEMATAMVVVGTSAPESPSPAHLAAASPAASAPQPKGMLGRLLGK